MADVVERTTTNTVTTKWYSSLLTPQTFLWILAGFVAVVLFWKDSKDNWAKIGTKADESEIIALKEQVNNLQGQVTRQYQTAKDDKEKEMKSIEEVADYMHEQIGYQKGLRDHPK